MDGTLWDSAENVAQSWDAVVQREAGHGTYDDRDRSNAVSDAFCKRGGSSDGSML